MFKTLHLYILIACDFVYRIQGLCGGRIKWSHHVNMDDVFGVWYGVGYAQHNPDMTNVPNEVGCVSLYITEANNELEDDWLDSSIQRQNYSTRNWRSSKSNPWSKESMAGSWLDIRLKRHLKRSLVDENRVRVLWEESGHTLQQVYLYNQDDPGLWTAEQLGPLEKQMIARGVDMWHPDDPPRHPDVIRLLNATSQTLVLNHCSELGNSGIFTLILRRSPSIMNIWEWREYQQQFYTFGLPTVYRYTQDVVFGLQPLAYDKDKRLLFCNRDRNFNMSKLFQLT